MSAQIQLLVTFILYLAFFAWIGYRRGMVRELLVLAIALGGYIALGQFQGKLIFLINTGWAFVAAGGPTTPEELLKIFEAPKLIPQAQQSTFIFLLWAGLLVVAYAIGNLAIKDAKSKPGGISAFIGMANGLTYTLILLPILARVLIANGAEPEAGQIGARAVATTARQTLAVLSGQLGDLWAALANQRSLIILTVVTVVILSAASTLTKARS